ncbi:hypothetical protein PLICRDRAFT_110279, partial [Plicaturopsis crispa FD-325 SS-3]
MQRNLLQIDNEIHALSPDAGDALLHLHERRKRLVQSLDEHIALLAPIRRCPPEILSEIFFCASPPSFGPFSEKAPVMLGRVCALWRKVSLATPRLW